MAAVALAASATNVSFAGPVYRFLIPDIDARAGDDVRVTIQGEHEESAQGFSIALRYPSDDLAIHRVHFEDTILEAIEADYFEAKVSPVDGTLVAGVLVDADAPFTGSLIPSIGAPLDFLHLECTISPAARGSLRLRFENGLSVPPIHNLYVVADESIAVTELGEGRIRLESGDGVGALFVRGDSNGDGTVDVSDPIDILGYFFLGEAPPRCLSAADVNDDDDLDISDAVYLLSYLFNQGPPPPPPSSDAGLDPTPGQLGCESSS